MLYPEESDGLNHGGSEDDDEEIKEEEEDFILPFGY